MAYKEKTGARSLMTIIEKTLRNYKFELPSLPIDFLLVDENLINDPEGYLKELKLQYCQLN